MSEAMIEAHAAIEADAGPPFPPSRGIRYSAVWLAYDEIDDRFFIVTHDCSMGLPTPPALHGHMGEIVAAADDRLGCHAGFVPWPPRDNEAP